MARTAMLALPCAESPLTVQTIEHAVDLYRRARRAGVAVRSSVECLIAACALRHHLTVVHCARDYAGIARVAALRHVDVSSRVKRAARRR